MILEFSLGNYRSYCETRTLSMIASNDIAHENENVAVLELPHGCGSRTFRVLKSAVLYGANASGKSNLLNGIKFMQRFLFDSSKETQAHEAIPVEPCLVTESGQKEPSFFEAVFFHNQVLYRYGFELTAEKIISEWLFFSPKGKEARLFLREEESFKIGEAFREGKDLKTKTRPNALFLSVCAQFNGSISMAVLDWFRSFNVISGIEDKSYLKFTLDKLGDEVFLEEIRRLMKIADLGIDDVHYESRDVQIGDISETEWDNMLFIDNNLINTLKTKNLDEIKNMKAIENKFSFMHSRYDTDNKKIDLIPFSLQKESQGTQKLFAVAGPLIDTLKHGKTLFIDELDTRLHPLITQFVVKLFHSSRSNPNNAQLIFATHDTNLLSRRFFRRDQVWFTEKNKRNVTDLYALSDYKVQSDTKVRKDATFHKDYIMGKYGAIPYVNESSMLYGDESGQE